MSGRDPLALQVAALTREVAAIQRRLDNAVRHGPVAKVDTEKQRVRLKVGKNPDGTDQLSPWVPYGQQAGALKIHTPPSEGQNMTIMAPGGDLEQSIALPMTWNDANASPSTSAEENVLTFGSVKMIVKGDAVRVEVGGFALEISGAGIGFAGGSLAHDGRDIGKSHRHTGVDPGSGTSGTPTGGGPSA